MKETTTICTPAHYLDGEFAALYAETNGFNDDLNRNERYRERDETFSAFISAGSTALIRDHEELVRKLI